MLLNIANVPKRIQYDNNKPRKPYKLKYPWYYWKEQCRQHGTNCPERKEIKGDVTNSFTTKSLGN